MPDAKGNDVTSHDNSSNVDAGNDTDDDAKRGRKPRAAKKARTTTAPHNSKDNPDDSVDKATTPRVTNKANKATRDSA